MTRRHDGRARARDGISAKIDHLFRTVRRSDGREYTYDEVEKGTDGRVSRSYVWKLRHGRNRNPSLDVVESLAEFFRVPPSYFFADGEGDEGAADEAATIASLLRDEWSRALLERSRCLSPSARVALMDMLEHLRRMDEAREA